MDTCPKARVYCSPPLETFVLLRNNLSGLLSVAGWIAGVGCGGRHLYGEGTDVGIQGKMQGTQHDRSLPYERMVAVLMPRCKKQGDLS